MEPKAGLEPATTRVSSDNPILRPVEIAGVHNRRLGQETASNAGVEPAASGFKGRHSTIELGRHIEPATGVEPITCDNPQLRPIKSIGAPSKMRARSDLDSTVALQVELLAWKREGGFEPPTYSVR